MVCCSGYKLQRHHQVVRKGVALLGAHMSLENLNLALECTTFFPLLEVIRLCNCLGPPPRIQWIFNTPHCVTMLENLFCCLLCRALFCF